MKIKSVIDKLDIKTLNRFKDFIDSPYYNKNQKLTALLAELSNHKRTFDKEKFWKQHYPRTSYSDGILRKLIHELFSLLEEFLRVENIDKSPILKLRLLAESGNQKGLFEVANKLKKNIDEIVSSDSIHSSGGYWDLYASVRSLFDLEYDVESGKVDKVEVIEDNIRAMNALLNSSFYLEKVKLSLFANHIANLSGSQILEENISLERLYSLPNTNHSIVHLYRKLYSLLVLRDENIEIESIIESLNLISLKDKKEARRLYYYVLNHLIRKSKEGDKRFDYEFQLHQYGLSSKLLFVNNRIDRVIFRNIAFTACQVKEYDWALNFVEEYKSYLSPEYRQSAYSFSKARIYWNLEDHESVIKTLQNVDYEDITYNLNSKFLLMTSLYELDEYDVLESTIKAFKVFLRRKRNISKARKANFSDLCDVIYQIIKAEDRNDPKRLVKAQQILNQNPGIPNREWLQDRITLAKKGLNNK